MKLIYTTPTCTACRSLKSKLEAEGTPYKELMIGRDITKEEFWEKHPGVRVVPFVVEEGEE